MKKIFGAVSFKKMTFSDKEHIAVTSDEQMIMSDKHLTSILFKVITAGDFALECLQTSRQSKKLMICTMAAKTVAELTAPV